jgi:NitT/TauT family transport system substrate-binding protein
MRKKGKFLISALCAAVIAAGLTASAFSVPAVSAPAAPFKIVVADANTTHHLNLYVAHELGIFDKYGLDVVIENVADNAAARDLVVSGGADVFWSCPTVAIAAVANGAPFKSIAQVKRPCTSVLVVEQDSPINAFSDLKGKEIAGISPTCEAVISLTVKANEAGGAFNLQKLSGGPAIAALDSKSVDGAILEEPHVSIAELKGYKVVFPDVSANIPCRTINASDRILASNAEELKAFIKAVDEANKVILSNPTAGNIVDIASRYTGAPKEAIIQGNDRLKFTITLDRDGISALGDELVKLGNIKENPKDRLFAEAFRGITW